MLTEVTAPRETDIDIVPLIVQISSSTLRVLRCNLQDLDPVDLSELKHLHSLELTTPYYKIKTSFDEIVPMIATVTSKRLSSLTICFPICQDWQPSSDQVGHPLEDAIFALGTLSLVVVSIPLAKHNKLAIYSKMFERYLPRLHEGNLLRVQCSSGHPEGETYLGHDAVVELMAASPDGQYIATGGRDGTVIIWSGATFPQKMLLQIQTAEIGYVHSLHFSDNGEFLAGVADDELLIWRVVDGVQVTSMPGFALQRSCAWLRQSPDYVTLSVVDSEWWHQEARRTTLSVTKVHVLHSGMVTTSESISLSPDHIDMPSWRSVQDRVLVAHSSSGLWVAVWHTAMPACRIWQMAESTPSYETYQLDFGHPHSLASCASFIGDTQLVIVFHDGTIRWWDISSSPLSTTEPCGILALFPKGAAVASLSVSPLHSFLVAWSSSDFRVFVLRRTKTRTAQSCFASDFALHVVLHHGQVAWITAACISPCERYIATASRDYTVRLWSTRDGELLWTFRDHDDEVNHLVFSSDGKVLAAAGGAGRVYIRVLAIFVRDVPVRSINDT